MEGFNVLGKARTGILSNNEKKNCNSCDSRIGFGTKISNTSGNLAIQAADNGDKNNTFWYNDQENNRLSTNGDEAIMMMWI